MTDRIPVKGVIVSGAATALAEFEPGDQIPSEYIAGLMGSNMLINCGVPVVNQKGFAGGALAANVYGYDRWKAGAGGCNITINATTGVFTHTSGPLVQAVESPEAAWGVPLTLSVESPSGTISVSIGGAAGSITAGAGRRSVTLTPTGSGNMVVQLTATGVTYSQPRLERGSVATLPEYRSAAIEFELCRRYVRKSYDIAIAPLSVSGAGREALGNAAATGLNNSGSIRWGGLMRTTPAVTIYSINVPAVGVVEQDNGSTVAASVVFIGQTGAQINWTNTVGRWGAFFQWLADAEIY